MDLSVTVETRVHPTEDEGKVERALRNIFPSGQIQKVEASGGEVILRIHGHDTDSLSNLRSLIRQEAIRSAARSILFGRTREQRTLIYLNKQAAFAGRVSFCEPKGESPHGPISIEIESSAPESLIDYLAPNPARTFSREPPVRRRR
jgi:predicted RNA binding protein with dsRBD fold (UPF0201 family)